MTAMTTEYLRDASQRAISASFLITGFSSDDLAHLQLLFRQSCLGSVFVNKAAFLDYEPVDLNTGVVHDRLRDPEIAFFMDAASRAALGGRILYEAPTRPLDENEASLLALAKQWYYSFVSTRIKNAFAANQGFQASTSLEDCQQLGIAAFLSSGVSADSRQWAALIQEDPRWAMACPAGDVDTRAALRTQWPQTIAWLDAYDVHQQLYSPKEALLKTWELNASLSAPAPVYDLPDLGY